MVKSNKFINKSILVAVLVMPLLLNAGQASAESPSATIPPGVVVEPGTDLSLPHVDDGNRVRNISMTSCGDYYPAISPLGFGWSGEYRWLNCSYWGYNSAAKKSYGWHVDPNSSSTACGQGYGFRTSGTPYWSAVGCGDSGSGTIQWGMTIAYPKFKVMSLSGLAVLVVWN